MQKLYADEGRRKIFKNLKKHKKRKNHIKSSISETSIILKNCRTRQDRAFYEKNRKSVENRSRKHDLKIHIFLVTESMSRPTDQKIEVRKVRTDDIINKNA